MSALHIRWPKYWSFSFGICPSNESSGLISFGIDWFDCLPSSRLHFKLEFYCKEEFSLFSFFFNYLLILVWIDGFLLCSVVYSLLLSSFSLFVQIQPPNPLHFGFYILLMCSHHLFKVLDFWTPGCLFQANLVLLLPSHGLSHYSKEAWFLQLEIGIQKPRSGQYVYLLLLDYHCF